MFLNVPGDAWFVGAVAMVIFLFLVSGLVLFAGGREHS
jgi:uncharacterized iron-regulated membrane protein